MNLFTILVFYVILLLLIVFSGERLAMDHIEITPRDALEHSEKYRDIGSSFQRLGNLCEDHEYHLPTGSRLTTSMGRLDTHIVQHCQGLATYHQEVADETKTVTDRVVAADQGSN